MTSASTSTALTSRIEADRELVIERVFRAPRALVFEAFTQAEHLRRWWAPRGWAVPHCTVDFRVGGRWHYCMECVDQAQGDFFGMQSWGLGVYEDIAAPERIVYTDFFSDADGGVNEAMPATHVTLTFEEVEGGTLVVNRAAYASADQLRTVLDMGMLQGVTDTWDRLAELLDTELRDTPRG
jgi:uncharacterized protein YndB with AHSA1/START domain